jgi:hypothetical protein
MGYKLLDFCHFKFLTMINTIVGAGAGAASRYGSGSGSDQKMRLLAAPAPAPQHCQFLLQCKKTCAAGKIDDRITLNLPEKILETLSVDHGSGLRSPLNLTTCL